MTHPGRREPWMTTTVRRMTSYREFPAVRPCEQIALLALGAALALSLVTYSAPRQPANREASRPISVRIRGLGWQLSVLWADDPAMSVKRLLAFRYSLPGRGGHRPHVFPARDRDLGISSPRPHSWSSRSHWRYSPEHFSPGFRATGSPAPSTPTVKASNADCWCFRDLLHRGWTNSGSGFIARLLARGWCSCC